MTFDRKIFEKHFSESLDKNFSPYLKYLDYKYKVFHELNTSFFEITKCLILGFHKASITLTNHTLERLLKLTLIKNEIGLKPIPIEQWNSVFDEPNRRFGSFDMSKTINLCHSVELINIEEKEILDTFIRKLIRNGFSHGDPKLILNDLPDESIGLVGSLKRPEIFKEVKLNYKIIPALQSAQIDNIAKEYSHQYFVFVFELMVEIEDRLKNKEKQ